MARPRADDYDEKRQLIRDRAAELFAARGFAATSTADIASSCDCSKALIYHYFDSKESILFDLLHAHVAALLEAATAALEGETQPRAQFAALVRAHLRLYATARAKHVLLLNELGSLPAKRKSAVVAIERQLVALVAELCQRLAPALGRRAELHVPVAMSFYGLINWTYTWYRAEGALTPDSFADLAATLFLDGLSAAVRQAA